MTEEQPLFENTDLTHAYTRADAHRDGVLIDVSRRSHRGRLPFPGGPHAGL
jgi:hypothetical protein